MGATRSILWSGIVTLAVVLPAAAAPSPAPHDTPQKKLLKLNELTGDDASLGKVFEFVEEGRGAKTLLQEAAKMAKDKGKDQPFNVNATLVLAQTAELLRESDVAETFYRIHIDQTLQLMSWEKLGKGYTGLIKTLYQARKFEESEKVCQEFLAINDRDKPSLRMIKPGVLRQMVLIMGKEGKTDKATELIDKIIQSQPDNPLNHVTKGQFLVDRGKMDEAVGAYQKAIDLIAKDEDLPKEEREDFIGSLRYTLSGVFTELNQIDKAADELKALLEKEPNNPGYNNDLGFIWADHDMNLPESEKLIRKAIDEDKKLKLKNNPELPPEKVKENPSYLDSLGWVLFKQKKYKEALTHLSAATKEEPESVEIWDHLGDVHMALGEKADAVAAWKKGLELKGDSKREQQRKAEIEKKLKANE
jgi:tetratricopeptide (TPR) repeat protein